MSGNFLETIKEFKGSGALAEQLSIELGDLVTAVIDTGKAGSLTLVLKVQPDSEGSIKMGATVKTAVPKPSVGEAIFFAAANGALSRSDPRQADLLLREPDAASREMRVLRGGIND